MRAKIRILAVDPEEQRVLVRMTQALGPNRA
jgi:hypothetical protein